MRYQTLAAAVLAVVCLGTSGVAQPSGDGDPPPGKGMRGPAKFLEGLPEEARERFLAAREKALEDPKLQELRKNAERAKREFFKAMRDKMLEIDPGLAEIVRKRSMERRARKVWRDQGGLVSLSDEEREKLLKVMEQVDNEPAVEAAKKKRWEASSDDDRKAAAEEYRRALHEAMAKVDPTIAPILDKLGPGQSPPSSPAGSTPSAKDPK